ncbi:hypothetical protein M405DRAFT_80177 [Rhizopogon salebrosus TDB-379]|nr:hypothetical protein M405DRAFT_80177 [Rhizopogon salebrosus TDB-379]
MAHPPSQLTSALFTQVGAAIVTGPQKRAPPIKLSASSQCKHSFTQSGTKAYAKLCSHSFMVYSLPALVYWYCIRRHNRPTVFAASAAFKQP